MKKRKWCYIHPPSVYEIACDKCGGTNTTWSEYEHMIWCYDCKIDTRGTGGIFDGPIAVELLTLLGISLNRFYFASPDKMFKPVTSGHRIIYRQCSAEEKAKWTDKSEEEQR